MSWVRDITKEVLLQIKGGEQMVKFPKVKVKLVGEDGNAFSILGRVTGAMRKGGVSKEDIEKYREEAMSGDYNNLLYVTAQYVSVS